MASLYRKWRPKNFDEVVGQRHVVETLRNALSHQATGHAYLFTGPRGTGKTSIARLLAKSLNCLNPLPEGGACNKCEICREIETGQFLDIYEIDAASNRGIDEIRDLREKVKFKPSRGKKKIYIIDEVHMLTREAFNALLKTLEEPPEHAVFILATTEPHKVPQTIISRTQRYDFRLAGQSELVNHLKKIAKVENVDIDDDALSILALAAEGSYRDALSIFEQIINISSAKIDRSTLEQILALVPAKTFQAIIKFWIKGDSAGLITQLRQIETAGADLAQFNKDLIRAFNDFLLVKTQTDQVPLEILDKNTEMIKICENASLARIIAQISALVESSFNIKNSPIPRIPIEIALVGNIAQFEQENFFQHKESKVEVFDQNSLKSNEQEQEIPVVEQSESSIKVIQVPDEQFQKAFLEAAKPLNHSIYATLKIAQVYRDNGICKISLQYPFHYEQLNKRAAKAILNGLAKQFECSEAELVLQERSAKKKSDNDDQILQDATEIFN